MDHRISPQQRGQLPALITAASWCPGCGAPLGKPCRPLHGGNGAQAILPHPSRQKIAAERFPKIAALIAADLAAKAAAKAERDSRKRHKKLSREQLEEAAGLQGTMPQAAIAKKYGLGIDTLRRYLQRAGLHRPAPLPRGPRGEWLKGAKANLTGNNGVVLRRERAERRVASGKRRMPDNCYKLSTAQLHEISAKLGQVPVAQLARDYRVGIATMWKAVRAIKQGAVVKQSATAKTRNACHANI